jgi:hypothetical protein
MIPAPYNLPTGYRGDSYGPISFYFNDISGNGISLDGGSGVLEVKNRKYDCPALSWDSFDNSIQISGNHLFLAQKSGVQMDVAAGRYFYDLQVVQSGVTKTYVSGYFEILDDITS